MPDDTKNRGLTDNKPLQQLHPRTNTEKHKSENKKISACQSVLSVLAELSCGVSQRGDSLACH